MTIHHDKTAYGKLASSSEELSEEKIAQMLAKLAAGQSEEASENEKKGEGDKENKNKK